LSGLKILPFPLIVNECITKFCLWQEKKCLKILGLCPQAAKEIKEKVLHAELVNWAEAPGADPQWGEKKIRATRFS
jgi:hypothetical protein